MAILKMKRLRVFAEASREEELLRELQLLGCVEVSRPDAALSDEGLSALSGPDAGGLAELRYDYSRLTQSIAVLDKYAPEKTGLLSAKLASEPRRVMDESALADTLEFAENVNYLDDQIRRVGLELNRLKNETEALSPWKELDLPLNFTGTETCAVICGTAPPSAELSAMRDGLSDAAPESELLEISRDSEQAYLALICLKTEREAALAALRDMGFAVATLPDVGGTAAEGMEKNRVSAEELEIGREGLAELIRARAERRDAVKLCADTLSSRISRAETAERLLHTERTVFLEGWVPEEKLEAVAALLEKLDCAWETEEPLPEEYPEVPVKLKNNVLTGPLSTVTDMYSLPAYDGIDPNPLMAPFFILLYGIMMADMGYGLLMCLGSLLMIKKMRVRGGARNLAGLLGLCGVSTFIFGALTGGFFGDFIPQLAKIINPDTSLTALPALFTPLEDTIAILIGSLVLGFIQIITGMVISVVRKIKNGDFIDALFSEITWWIILAGAALAIFGIGSVGGVPVVLVAGILMLAVGGTREAKGFGKVTSFIGLAYNGASGFFSDTLSYSRVMALMLAGSVVAQVFNTIGAVTGNAFAFVIISMIGNALNFALNLLGCFVHDLRLQCLEFFNRFYKDGGRPFAPLSVQTKYYDVSEQN